MTNHLADVIDALVMRGWPCDPTDVCPPCWYTMRLPEHPGLGCDADYEPCNMLGRPGVLWIYPTTDLRLTVEVAPSGSLGGVCIETTGAPGSRVGEQTLHTGPWVDLNTHLRHAGASYQQAVNVAGRAHG